MVPTCQGQWPIFPPPTATDRLPSTHRLLLKILYFSVLIFLLPNDCFVSFFLTVLRFMTSKYWLLGGLMPTPLFVSNPTLGDLTQHAGFVCHCYANDSHSLAPSLTYSIDSRLIYPVSYSTPLSGWETYPTHVQLWSPAPNCSSHCLPHLNIIQVSQAPDLESFLSIFLLSIVKSHWLYPQTICRMQQFLPASAANSLVWARLTWNF